MINFLHVSYAWAIAFALFLDVRSHKKRFLVV